MRGAIPSRSCGARSEVITSRRPAVMISFIVWKNSSWVESLPAMNWTSSISSRSAERSRPLKPIVSFSFSARTNSTMNFSADIDTTRAPGRRFEEGLADGVQQMGLAAPGAAMKEQRVEGDAVGGGQRPRGGRRDFIGLADDERVEAVARVEIGRRGIALARPAAAPPEFPRGSAAAPAWDRRPKRRFAPIADDRQDRTSTPAPAGRRNGELHPVGHELARHDDVELARFAVERAELGGLQPAVEGARAADRGAARRESRPRRRRGAQRRSSAASVT